MLLHDQHRTETDVVIAVPVVTIEGKGTCISGITPIASAFEERISRVRKVRVVRFNPSILNNLGLENIYFNQIVLNSVPVFMC